MEWKLRFKWLFTESDYDMYQGKKENSPNSSFLNSFPISTLKKKRKAKTTNMWQILKDFKDIHHLIKLEINSKASFDYDNTILIPTCNMACPKVWEGKFPHSCQFCGSENMYKLTTIKRLWNNLHHLQLQRYWNTDQKI